MIGLEEFIAFAEKVRLLDKLPRGGNLQSVVPRILGNGKTRAEGLFDEKKPPALIERQYEYAKLDLNKLFGDINYPALGCDSLRAEQAQTQQQIKSLQEQLERPNDGWERSAREALYKLGEKTPGRGGRYAMGDIELSFDKKTFSWAWTYRGAYPLVSKLPHDVDYICDGFHDASRRMKEAIVPAAEFLASLQLAWVISKQRSGSGPVLIRDLAKVYQVAAQPAGFWDKPAKSSFTEIPDAVFVINLVHAIDEVRKLFVLEKAGLHQTALGGKGKNVSYDLPKGSGGTEPYSTIRLKDQ
ncbi:MAG TPA: hypothetical protein PKV55_12985 [Nitrospira sp.]|nr:hypothetical protein [Nitrospira sp.]HNK14792.1 hypothetical protein [Nitrospira sp.]HNL89390.1 hypothetical protein [Nitrospira sp.]HNO35074.1 hypothetical protein [Nitrospira sp.]